MMLVCYLCYLRFPPPRLLLPPPRLPPEGVLLPRLLLDERDVPTLLPRLLLDDARDGLTLLLRDDERDELTLLLLLRPLLDERDGVTLLLLRLLVIVVRLFTVPRLLFFKLMFERLLSTLILLVRLFAERFETLFVVLILLLSPLTTTRLPRLDITLRRSSFLLVAS